MLSTDDVIVPAAHDRTWKVIIASLLILSIIGLLAVAALLWCLAGFSRALKETPKVVGLPVQVGNNDAGATKRRKQLVIPLPESLSLPQRVSAARFQKYGSLNLLILTGLATLFASLGTGFYFMGAI